MVRCPSPLHLSHAPPIPSSRGCGGFAPPVSISIYNVRPGRFLIGHTFHSGYSPQPILLGHESCYCQQQAGSDRPRDHVSLNLTIKTLCCGPRDSYHCVVMVLQGIENGINAGTAGLLALSLPFFDGSAPLFLLLLVASGGRRWWRGRGRIGGGLGHGAKKDGKNMPWKEV